MSPFKIASATPIALSRTKKSAQAYRPVTKWYTQENVTNSLQKKKEKATSRKSLNGLIENTWKRNNEKASIECEKQLKWDTNEVPVW